MTIKINWILSLMFFLVFSSGCKNQNKNKIPLTTFEKKGSGRIEFVSEMHNFGTLKAGEIVSFSFEFKNSGSRPFKVQQVIRSCDCVNVNYRDQDVLPGQNSEVDVILSTAGEWGNLLKTVEVHTSAGEKKILTINAYVENEQFDNLLKKER